MSKSAAALIVCSMAVLGGCASMGEPVALEAMATASSRQRNASEDGRLLIRSASLTVEVGDASESATKAIDIVTASGGFVEQSTSGAEGTVELVVRIPEAKLDGSLRGFEELGDVIRKSLLATDVTAEVVDLDARMKNLVVTRDSYRQLLEKAVSVQDVVAVEKELSRVQGEIDSMEARLKGLRSRVALSEVKLELRKRRILGPIGYVGKRLWWLVSKLFVISP